MSDSVDWKNTPGGRTVPDLYVPDPHVRGHRLRWPQLRPPAEIPQPEQRELTFGVADILRRVRNGYASPTSHGDREMQRDATRASDTGPTLF